MTELATVQNISTGPVLITPEGNVLGAGEFGTAAVRTDHVRQLINAGLVAEVTDAPSKAAEVDRQYGQAHRDTVEKRAEQTAKDKDERPSTPRATRATTEES